MKGIIKSIITSIFISLVAALLVTSVKASETDEPHYRIGRLPVVDQESHQIGTLVIQRRGDTLYSDYDFSLSPGCYLESIETWIHSTGDYRHYIVSQPRGQALEEFPNTYIAPNDAVLAFDVDNHHPAEAIRMSAHLLLNCNGNHVSAWPTASTSVSATMTPTFVYRASTESNYQSWWRGRPYNDASTNVGDSDDGYELYYDEQAGEYAYRNRLKPTPTPSSRTSSQRSSSQLPQTPLNVDRDQDGYELYYDERAGEYAFRNRLQSNARSRDLSPTPVNTDRAGDGYILSWDNLKNWWYWRNTRDNRSS